MKLQVNKASRRYHFLVLKADGKGYRRRKIRGRKLRKGKGKGKGRKRPGFRPRGRGKGFSYVAEEYEDPDSSFLGKGKGKKGNKSYTPQMAAAIQMVSPFANVNILRHGTVLNQMRFGSCFEHACVKRFTACLGPIRPRASCIQNHERWLSAKVNH